MCAGMCTMWPAPGISAARRFAYGSARSGVVDASTAWM
jgi:hypothetical protein